MKLIYDYLMLIKEPSKFFSEKKTQKKYTQPLYFFIALYIVYLLFEILASSITYYYELIPLIDFYMMFLAFLLLVILIWGIPFFLSSVTYLGVIIFNGKTKFFDVFKAVSYSGTIYAVYGTALGLISLLYSIINKEIISVQGFTGVILNIIFITGIIHTVYVQSIGINKYTNLSKIKSILAILIIPVLLFLSLIILSMLLVLGSSGNLV